ncbi:MAG: ABC transporter permease [Bacillota bacterium]
MSLLDSFSMAWLGIGTNKGRAALTMLGVIIGVAAVIALVSVGQGATEQITSQVQALGSNLIVVVPVRNTRLTEEIIASLPDRVSTISAAVPSVSSYVTAKWGTTSKSTQIEGVTPEYTGVRSSNVAVGRFITQQDVDQMSRVCVIGQQVVEDIFDNSNPLGQELSINGQRYLVVGIMEEKGNTMGQNMDDRIFLPITSAKRLIGTDRISSAYVQAKSAGDAPLAVAHLTAVFNAMFGRENSVMVSSQDQLLSTIGTMTATMTLMLGAIAGISLVVGGIGIMNIMLVSVSERTREIGIRKAIGAGRPDIMSQFLVESVLLSVTGGAIGILGGVGVSRVLSRLLGFTTVVSPSSVIISFLFSAAIGIVFGMYPAIKAAKMIPVEALRYE